MAGPPGAKQDLLDPRQRQAAAILLSAIALPAPMTAWAEQVQEACRILPGLTVSERGGLDRIAGLERARDLINEMLAEHERGVVP